MKTLNKRKPYRSIFEAQGEKLLQRESIPAIRGKQKKLFTDGIGTLPQMKPQGMFTDGIGEIR